MVLEYTIKFEKNGLIISQRMDVGSQEAFTKPKAPVEQKSLAASYKDSKAAGAASEGSSSHPSSAKGGGGFNDSPRGPGGGGFNDSPRGPGGGGFNSGAGAITLIGPIILTCTPYDPKSDTTKTSGE